MTHGSPPAGTASSGVPPGAGTSVGNAVAVGTGVGISVTLGRVGNTDHQNVKLGKAGRKRHMGRRPHVRGTAMNPIDHPLGGGEGRTKGGRHPCSPTAVLAKGGRTRKRKHRTDNFIIRRRKRKRG